VCVVCVCEVLVQLSTGLWCWCSLRQRVLSQHLRKIVKQPGLHAGAAFLGAIYLPRRDNTPPAVRYLVCFFFAVVNNTRGKQQVSRWGRGNLWMPAAVVISACRERTIPGRNHPNTHYYMQGDPLAHRRYITRPHLDLPRTNLLQRNIESPISCKEL